MKVLIVVCALLACVAADCGQLQRLKVKTQWGQAFGTGNQRNDFARAMFRSIFIQAPEARDLFKRVNGEEIRSGEFTAHATRVLGGLDICISALDDEDLLNAELSQLNMQHAERGIPARYFDLFKNSLLKIVPAAIGRCFDEQAWDSCYDVITNGIKNGENSLVR